MEVHERNELIELRTEDAVLNVTSDHRTSVLRLVDSVQDEMPAGDLTPGDLVFENNVAKPLLSVSKKHFVSSVKVLKIVFSPDVPVGAFSCPSHIVSQGSKRKPLRRGGRRRPFRGVNNLQRDDADQHDHFSDTEYRTQGECGVDRAICFLFCIVFLITRCFRLCSAHCT